MKRQLISIFRKLTRKLGYDVSPFPRFGYDKEGMPEDLSDLTKEVFYKVKPFTMTCVERIDALVNSICYLVKNNIEGAMVECGVWKGGSIMAMALVLKELGIENRDIFLYDTFSGMTKPAEIDVSVDGESAKQTFAQKFVSEKKTDWCFSSMEEVKRNVYSTGYPESRFHFVAGKVEDTIPFKMPDRISLLRLDTDWYKSTKHEMNYLYPLLTNKGVLIIDDYGYWKGSRKAVDEYVDENSICLLLNKTDNFGARIAIKP